MRSTPSAPGAANTPGEKNHRRFLLVAGTLVGLLGAGPGQARAEPAAPAATAPVYETVVRAPARNPSAPREDLTASASVITSERTPRSGENLPQLLAEQPGLAVTRFGSYGSLSTLSVRGSPANQVAIYVDGVPLSGALVGTVDLGLVPPSVVQRIEIYRGTSPLGFGSSAMGGVVSITSEAPAASGLALESGAGSFATRHGGLTAALRGSAGSVVARLGLFRSRADFPYSNDNGTVFNPRDDRTVRRENNDLDQLDGSLRGALELPGQRELVLSLSGLAREQGLPARGIFRSLHTRLDRRRVAASASYESLDDLGEGGRWKATLYGLGSEQRFDDPAGEIAFVPTTTRDRSLTAGATALASRALGESGLVLSALLDARHERFRPHDVASPARPAPETPQRLPGSRQFAAAGLSATQWLAPLRLELLASLRGEAAYDQISPEGDLLGRPASETTSEGYLLPIARLGLSQVPHPAVRLRANLGRYARLPTLFERYGNAGTIKGNAGLRPESGYNADLGGSWRLARGPHQLVIDGALFLALSRHLIHFQQQGYFASFENIARARSRGAELSIDGQAYGWLHLFLKGTALDARDTSDTSGQEGRRLPQLPAWRAYLRPELRELPLGGGLSLGLYGDAELSGQRYQDRANQVPQAGRVVVGAGASLGYRGPQLPTELRLVASAYNLGDVLTPDVLDYPTPGRSFFLTLQLAYFRKEPYR